MASLVEDANVDDVLAARTVRDALSQLFLDPLRFLRIELLEVVGHLQAGRALRHLKGEMVEWRVQLALQERALD